MFWGVVFRKLDAYHIRLPSGMVTRTTTFETPGKALKGELYRLILDRRYRHGWLIDIVLKPCSYESKGRQGRSKNTDCLCNINILVSGVKKSVSPKQFIIMVIE